MNNCAAYMTGINQIEIRELSMPVPKADQVLIKLECVGICGSDMHYLEHGRIGDYVVSGDFILGHECAGTVVETGGDVKSLRAGDKVALEPGIPCGKCVFCKTGKYNLCPDVEFLATPPYHGALVKYIAYPESMCFKLPDHMTTKQGALVEPLAVGIHAARQGRVALGDNAVILGAGCIGLCTQLACKAMGATNITMADILDKRLEYAQEFGAARVIDTKSRDVLEVVNELTQGQGCDIVLETAGSAVTIKQTPFLVKRGGRIVLVGLAPQDIIDFNFMQVMWKEVEIQSVFRYRNIYPIAVNAIASGAIPIDGIVSHEFSMEEAAYAFAFVTSHKPEVVKAIIRID